MRGVCRRGGKAPTTQESAPSHSHRVSDDVTLAKLFFTLKTWTKLSSSRVIDTSKFTLKIENYGLCIFLSATLTIIVRFMIMTYTLPVLSPEWVIFYVSHNGVLECNKKVRWEFCILFVSNMLILFLKAYVASKTSNTIIGFYRSLSNIPNFPFNNNSGSKRNSLCIYKIRK